MENQEKRSSRLRLAYEPTARWKKQEPDLPGPLFDLTVVVVTIVAAIGALW